MEKRVKVSRHLVRKRHRKGDGNCNKGHKKKKKTWKRKDHQPQCWSTVKEAIFFQHVETSLDSRRVYVPPGLDPASRNRIQPFASNFPAGPQENGKSQYCCHSNVGTTRVCKNRPGPELISNRIEPKELVLLGSTYQAWSVTSLCRKKSDWFKLI